MLYPVCFFASFFVSFPTCCHTVRGANIRNRRVTDQALGQERLLLRRQAFGLGASLRLIAKPLLCADPRRAPLDPLVPAGTVSCYGFAAQRFVRLQRP